MKYKARSNGRNVEREDYSKLLIFDRSDFERGDHELQIVTVPPRTAVRPHSHTARTEVFYVLDGEADLTIGNEKQQARPGDAFICRPGERHFARNRSDSEFRLLVFKLDLPGEEDTVWEGQRGAVELARPQIVELSSDHREWAVGLVRERWGASEIVTRGRIHDTAELQGFVATLRGEPVGLATYRMDEPECEMVSLDSLMEGIGIGSALVDAVAAEARDGGCRRLWLITTNDNLDAIHFYQKRGFLLVAIHRNALEETRRLKPGLPMMGIDGIPLRDEVEMETLL
jgi:quercetin dioxygenase-like cupin family protein/N-acetylglutamate synthase-like GNAT family acetyltransferase